MSTPWKHRHPPPSHAIGSRRTAGFTLIELLVTLTVFAILVSLATPSFFNMLATNRMTTQTNEFVVALNTAKSEAVRRGHSVTLLSSNDATPINFHQGWQLFTDADADGAAADPATEEDGTMLRESAPLAGGVAVVRVTRTGTAPSFTYADATSLAGNQLLTFNSRGGLQAGAAFFRICNTSAPGLAGRIVQVSVVGRVSLDSTTVDCSE